MRQTVAVADEDVFVAIAVEIGDGKVTGNVVAQVLERQGFSEGEHAVWRRGASGNVSLADDHINNAVVVEIADRDAYGAVDVTFRVDVMKRTVAIVEPQAAAITAVGDVGINVAVSVDVGQRDAAASGRREDLI